MERIRHSSFFISSLEIRTSISDVPHERNSLTRRRMGSGGLRGLQNRCFGAEASKGWFDSDTPPPLDLLKTRDLFPRCLGAASFIRRGLAWTSADEQLPEQPPFSASR